MQAWEAAKNALQCVLEAKKGEKIVIFCDQEKNEIGQAFSVGALKIGLETHLTPLKTEKGVYRKDIPQQVQEILKKPPDIYINIFRGIREEAPFRIELIKQETSQHKARLGHCPGVTIDMLTEGAMALKAEEHKKMQAFAKTLIKKLAHSAKIRVTNPAGTDVTFSVKNRDFFTDTIINWKTLKWMNLPTGEVIVAPVEDSLEGSLICDLAVGGIGPIKTPIKLEVGKGKVQKSFSSDKKLLDRVRESLATDDKASTVGEFAFGINPKARFVEEFLEAEKQLKTIHFAFGNNSDFPGGKNPSKNHLDMLVSRPNVTVYKKDGEGAPVLTDGAFVLNV